MDSDFCWRMNCQAEFAAMAGSRRVAPGATADRQRRERDQNGAASQCGGRAETVGQGAGDFFTYGSNRGHGDDRRAGRGSPLPPIIAGFARSGDRHAVRCLAGGREAHVRRAFLRQLQVDPRRRQVDQLAGGVQRQVHRVLVAELLQLLRVVAADPARRGHADVLERRIHAVLVLQPVGHHVELQHAHGAENEVVAHDRLEELGGAMSHASKSGVATFVSADEQSCLQDVRYLLSFLPQNNLSEVPASDATDDPMRMCESLRTILPASPNQPYDMKKVIAEVMDDGEFFEYFPHWAKSIVCGFSRLNGQAVGVVGNQPMVLAGVLDIESSEKAARFVRTCDAFNIPIVTFVDVPGFLPGVDQEYGGIIRHGAKLLYAYCESTVPRIQVITRKAYGGAYVVMNSKSIGADLAYAWPTAELAVMGPQGAVEIVYRRELQQAADPVARRAELVNDYTEKYANPYNAAERGYIDDVIDPAETRTKLIAGLKMLQSKREELPRRKHGNMPL
mgnify:CR=1 FL=1